MNGYVFDFSQHGKFSPDGAVEPALSADEIAAHNRHLSEQEVAAVRSGDLHEFGAYPDFAKLVVTTWYGGVLGEIVESKTFWKRSFKRLIKMGQVKIRAVDGNLYVGRARIDPLFGEDLGGQYLVFYRAKEKKRV